MYTTMYDPLLSIKSFIIFMAVSVCSEILKVIAALLKNAPAGPETMVVRRVFLSDMIKLFNNSRENRR